MRIAAETPFRSRGQESASLIQQKDKELVMNVELKEEDGSSR